MRFTLLTVTLFMSFSFLRAAVIDVPADYATIQEAIDSAQAGDTVIVAEGQYFERISFLGKAITVASEFILDGDTLHIANTVIDGTDVAQVGDTSSLIRFANSEGSTSVFRGFTVANDSIGIYCFAAGPSIAYCYIRNCDFGILSVQANPNQSNCAFSGNGCAFMNYSDFDQFFSQCGFFGNGYGVRIRYGTAVLDACHFEDNTNSISLFNPGMANASDCRFINSPLIASPGGKSADLDQKGLCTITTSYLLNSPITFSYSGVTLDYDSLINSNIGVMFDDSYSTISNCYLFNCSVSAFESGFNLSNCFLYGTVGTGSTNAGPMSISNSTVLTDGIGLLHGMAYFSNSVLISASGGPVFTGPGSSETTTQLHINCTDIYGVDNGVWIVDYPPEKIDTSHVYFIDPLFCDTASGDYSIMDASVCAPENNDCGMLMGAYGIGCSSSVEVTALSLGGEAPANVVSHEPLLVWQYMSIPAFSQDSCEIAVGNDSDWTAAELWNPGPYETFDTAMVYAGDSLIDGATYFARVRVKNGFAWSDWAGISFRMNSAPSMPTPYHPIDSEVVASDQPYLWVLNALDAEDDSLFYDYGCYFDCVLIAGSHNPETPDSTGWMIDSPLWENGIYDWSARAFDGFEYSDWTPVEFFQVNSIETYPAPFMVVYPPDTGWSQVYDFPVWFDWTPSLDSDPDDSVYYTLLLSTDEDFIFVAAHDSLYADSVSISGLACGTHYWWKVEASDTRGHKTVSDNTADFLTWVLGDANHDAAANIGDAVFLISFIFADGPAPEPLKIGDINEDCEINIGDAVYLINFVFRSGPAPLIGCVPE